MKLTFNFLIRLLSVLILCSPSAAQEGKHTEKLEQLFSKKEFAKLIKFKKKKRDKLSSKSLYWIGMAYYMTEDNSSALKLLDLAIGKGPADQDMYYYKGILHLMQENYEMAIEPFNYAIAIVPSEPAFHLSKGEAYYQMEVLDSAMQTFQQASKLEGCNPVVYLYIAEIEIARKNFRDAAMIYANNLSLFPPNTSEHERCSFNTGLAHQLAGDHELAKAALKNHIEIYPNDYHAISKLIQAKFALGAGKETQHLKEQLVSAYHEKLLPRHLRKMYCFDQFVVDSSRVLAFEPYEPYWNEILVWAHKFMVQDSSGNIDFKIQTILDTTATESDNKLKYTLALIKNDTIRWFNHFTFLENSNYQDLKKAVIKIINSNVEPSSELGGYTKWLSTKQEEKIGLLGSSFEHAISVNSVAEEYEWLREYYPGHNFTMQSLVFEEDKPYDILQIETAAGVEKEVFFDISSFYGKWFD